MMCDIHAIVVFMQVFGGLYADFSKIFEKYFL